MHTYVHTYINIQQTYYKFRLANFWRWSVGDYGDGAPSVGPHDVGALDAGAHIVGTRNCGAHGITLAETIKMQLNLCVDMPHCSISVVHIAHIPKESNLW